YGLAADARQPDAVARIFEIKGRPADHPLIVHLADPSDIDEWAINVPDTARRLAEFAWPGPLTMLLHRADGVIDLVTGGRSTIGLRVPSHPLTRRLLARLGSGIAAPSANRFGRVSPTTAEHVLADIGDRLDPERDLILDGGPSSIGIESTIVDLTVNPPQILRAGAITADDLEWILSGDLADASGPSRTSGMLAAHYAPALVIVVPAESRAAAETEAVDRRQGGERVVVLDRTNDLVVAAQQLYTDLREADAGLLDAVIVVLPPAQGLGHAIRDRVLKAAAANPGPPSPTG
ncbi:MAG: L-threonylcarbamoyladenylate synthase, partial [Ilumatobacteraceae bacterium]